jgi:hypothetical protein
VQTGNRIHQKQKNKKQTKKKEVAREQQSDVPFQIQFLGGTVPENVFLWLSWGVTAIKR